MKKYRQLQAALLAILAGTFALGMVSALRPAGEIFPFASWFLFSLVPQQVTSYDVLVRSWGQKKFDPARPLIEVEGLLTSPRSSTIFQLVQRYGRAIESGNQPEAAEAWRLLQAKFSSPETLEIELVKRTYDPIERARGGKVEQIGIPAPATAPAATNSDKEKQR